jgi:hypothetical protein
MQWTSTSSALSFAFAALAESISTSRWMWSGIFLNNRLSQADASQVAQPNWLL